jgi:hypothetical protein
VISGYLFAIVLSVCPVASGYLFAIVLIQWQKDNQKSQRRDRQYNDKKITRNHREGQTENTMAICLSFSLTSSYLFAIVLSVCPL